MYAIIEDSGQQFKVSTGDVIRVDVRDLPEDAKQVTFDRVLLVSDEQSGKIGTPLVDNAKVVADIQNTLVKGDKIDVIKFKRRKGYRRKQGHRQKYLQVKIAEIVA
ncbi:MAG: 50S ribosomal protein L21 [Planctomycetes bacterium]|nr:50S ribosomal protein L21 [Planctomycetota bacterium]